MQDVINDPTAAAATYVSAVPDRKGQEKKVQRVFELYKQYVYGGQRIPGVISSRSSRRSTSNREFPNRRSRWMISLPTSLWNSQSEGPHAGTGKKRCSESLEEDGDWIF